MPAVASQLIEEVTVHAQSDSLEDVQEICADNTYFPNNLHIRNMNCGIIISRRVAFMSSSFDVCTRSYASVIIPHVWTVFRQ